MYQFVRCVRSSGLVYLAMGFSSSVSSMINTRQCYALLSQYLQDNHGCLSNRFGPLIQLHRTFEVASDPPCICHCRSVLIPPNLYPFASVPTIKKLALMIATFNTSVHEVLFVRDIHIEGNDDGSSARFMMDR
jgi:hypothetical protein